MSVSLSGNCIGWFNLSMNGHSNELKRFFLCGYFQCLVFLDQLQIKVRGGDCPCQLILFNAKKCIKIYPSLSWTMRSAIKQMDFDKSYWLLFQKLFCLKTIAKVIWWSLQSTKKYIKKVWFSMFQINMHVAHRFTQLMTTINT